VFQKQAVINGADLAGLSDEDFKAAGLDPKRRSFITRAQLREHQRAMMEDFQRGNGDAVVKFVGHRAAIRIRNASGFALLDLGLCNSYDLLEQFKAIRAPWFNTAIVQIDNIRVLGRSFTYAFQRSDAIIMGAVLAAQTAHSAIQLWRGEMTVLEFCKEFGINVVSLGAAFAGGAVCAAAVTAVGVALAATPPGWVITISSFIGAIIFGIICSKAASTVMKWILNKLFPDGPEEQENARLLVLAEAMAALQVTRQTPFHEARKKYLALAR
jgi:hypothetical protein